MSFGIGDCYCIKSALIECGHYRYRRLIGGADPTEPRWNCSEYKIVDCPWTGAGDCTQDHHAKIEKIIEEFDWTSTPKEIVQKVGYGAIDMTEFNWLEDADVLAEKASYEAEQEIEFKKLLNEDPYAKALLDGVELVRTEKEKNVVEAVPDIADKSE